MDRPAEREEMKEQLLEFITISMASIFVMIIHELPKSIMYNCCNKKQSRSTKLNIYKIYHYIDPIGLLLCITTYSGFSKPYMYRIKEKRTNLLLGITGCISLILCTLISAGIVRFYFMPFENAEYSTTVEWIIYNFSNYFFQSVAVISVNMLIVNLIPISTFDMGLIIAGKSPSKYFSIIRNDYLIKMILLALILFGIVPTLGQVVIGILLL